MSDTSRFHRVWPPRKSRIVGPARLPDGATTMAYRAVQPYVCEQCGAEIPPDALFSRRTIQRAQTLATNMARMPVCVACRPLQVEGDVGGMDGARRQGGEEEHHDG